MLLSHDLQALWLTLELAGLSTLILLILGLPLAWWLAHRDHMGKRLIEVLVALPLVLPPTVLGFYLLIAFAPQSTLGQGWLALTGTQLAFSFSGLVLGSVLYSLPFVVQPLQASFSQLDRRLLENAAILGASTLDRFFTVVIPLCRRGLLTAITLGFAHTVGEFGVVLMIGGNIPGETQVLSIALFDHVETLEYERAHLMAGGLLLFSFVLLMLLYTQGRNGNYRVHT